MCLLAMSMSFLRNVYLYLDLLSFSFFAIELYELFVYFGDQFLVSGLICKYWVGPKFHSFHCNILWKTWMSILTNLIFSLILRVSLISFMFSFAVQNLVSLIRSHLFIFFYFHYPRRWVKKGLAVIYASVLPMFSTKSLYCQPCIYVFSPFWVYFCVCH